jgi:hypothetical protein
MPPRQSIVIPLAQRACGVSFRFAGGEFLVGAFESRRQVRIRHVAELDAELLGELLGFARRLRSRHNHDDAALAHLVNGVEDAHVDVEIVVTARGQHLGLIAGLRESRE